MIYGMNSSAAHVSVPLIGMLKAVPPTVSMPVSLYPLYEAGYCSLACTVIPSVTAAAERDFSGILHRIEKQYGPPWADFDYII